jgi:tRNA dimethylallyltransferase
MELARRLGDVEIVTADSMQVYRGMDIGTAKPTASEQAEVRHHLIDLVGPEGEWSVAEWVAAARHAVAGIEAAGRRALLVGGTGLYVQALVDDLEPPGRFPEVVTALADEGDTASLHRRLRELDPLSASRMEPGNRRRVLRALEVCLGTGRPFSSFGPGLATYAPNRWSTVGLWLPRAVVARRIETRVADMVTRGLVAETAGLAELGLSRTASQALGYREILAHLAGNSTLPDALEEVGRRTRAFARRQRVWWRRDPRITWVGAAENPLAVIPLLLGHWRQS